MKRILPPTLFFIIFLVCVSQGRATETLNTTNSLNALAPSTPEEEFAVSLTAGGPYRAPTTFDLIASVTHPPEVTVTKVEFYQGTKRWTPKIGPVVKLRKSWEGMVEITKPNQHESKKKTTRQCV